jgi:peptidoglycan hydrolase-like protein with peptidoglycan-binding domain
VAVGIAAVVIAVTVGWVVASTFLGGPTSEPAPPATVQVSRRDLVETRPVPGTLGYGEEHDIPNWARGVVTWLPGIGSTVSRGEVLYRVDEIPVVLMYGQVPMYRTLQAGVAHGSDVQELEENLAALGYTGFTVDGEYTPYTASAVKRWQANVGLPQTGAVELGRVVVEPAAVRVTAAEVPLGGQASPGQPILTCTGTAHIVTVDLPVTEQNLATRGEKVAVELPDNRTVNGTVAEVGTVARAPEAGSGQATSTPTIDVIVTLDDPASAGTLDQAPVEVLFVVAKHTGVLAVPVSALLALPGGGHGVRVVEGRTSHVVPVHVGISANGYAEVSGQGITAGTTVELQPGP